MAAYGDGIPTRDGYPPYTGRVAIALMAKLREDEVYPIGQVACLPDGHEVKSRIDHVTVKS